MAFPDDGPEPPHDRFTRGDAVGRLFRLVRKELSELLRDRRTIITLVLMPLLLYPLLSIAFQQVAAANLLHPNRIKEKRKVSPSEKGVPDFLIAVENDDDENFVSVMLEESERHEEFMRKVSSKAPEVDKARPSEAGEVWRVQVVADLEAEVQSGKFDIGIRVTRGEQPSQVLLEVVNLEGSALSQNAVHMIERRLLWFHQSSVAVLITKFKSRRPVLAYLEHKTLKAPGDGAAISLPALVPLILILMTITGAVYPAIDTTAGERERGTLEMLVAAPVPRLGLLFAKYVTVVAVAMLTGLVNLAGMTVTLKFSGLEQDVIKGGLSLVVLLQVVALLFLFALFFSALLLSLTSFARSFKEAQSYLIPLMLVSLGPGIIGILPGIELEGFLIVAPLVNIVLLGRDLFEGKMDPAAALLVVLVTLMYAGAAIALAARVFGAESVLYSEQSGWSDLFRRPEQPRPVSGVAAALWCLALMIPVRYVVQGSIQLIGVSDPAAQLGLSVGLSVLLFLGFPLLAVWIGRVRWDTGFALLAPGPIPLAAGLILGICLWPGVLWALSFLVDEAGLPVEMREQLVERMRLIRRYFPLGVLLTVMAIGIVEELFFRGFLFSALERACPAWANILATALLFGLLHVVMGGPIGAHRFLPSTAMGLLLGWTRFASGSVWPGLALHAAFNGAMELALQSGAGDRAEIPLAWAVGSLAALVLGTAALLYYGKGVSAGRSERT